MNCKYKGTICKNAFAELSSLKRVNDNKNAIIECVIAMGHNNVSNLKNIWHYKIESNMASE